MAKSRAQYIQEHSDGSNDISFDLVDEATVKRLQKDKKIKVPKKKVDIPKDKRWNEKQMASKILQGIQNGDSIPKMSKAMTEVIGNNLTSAIRNTRTMTTSAECNGRLDSYKKLADQGVVQKKVWMATPDDRTRPTHIDLDGEEQDIDKAFSNGCQFPGDGNGPAEEVWQCRCTMTDHIIGFKRADGSISYVDYNRDKTLHDEQMEEEKEKRTSKDTSTHTVVDGKDISTTWGRRADKFDFEIEDVINAQGFDGLPRVVSADEFDRYVQEANNGNGFIAQRTYSAPNQETLDAYRDQLYNGKWYVDCSTGGAQYGQGMYCAADYTGKITDGMRNEMAHYQKLGQTRATKIVDNEQINKAVEVQWGRIKSDISFPYDNDGKILHSEEEVKEELRKAIGNLYGGEIEKLYGVAGNNKFAIENKFSYTETLTLDPSAKIIKYDEINDLRREQEEKIKLMLKEKNKGLDEILDSDKRSENKKWRDAKLSELRDMDDGSFAAMLGYDAINAEGHGASGSYTVILNRTKVIFKRE